MQPLRPIHPTPRDMPRRAFLQGAAALPLAALAQANSWGATPVDDGSAYPGLIVRQAFPENFEFPFPTLNSFATPNNLFYVRNHFGTVKDANPRTWRLRVEGHVERPLELSMDDLRSMPTRTQFALLECAGNGRVFLVPRPEGMPWELGAVSNAEWVGVPLAVVLERAGLKSEALEVICEGADSGEAAGNRDEARTPGKIPYARSLPLDKARSPEVLLAYKMNGTDLPAMHGFPMRLIVPGWYGMASVKWLKRLIVTNRPFLGYFQTMVYSYFERRDGLTTLVPTTELQVKAQIARPVRHEIVRPGTTYRVHGAAWTGDSEITRVDLSTDGGKTWAPARLLDRSIRHAWRLWEYPWQTPKTKGSVTLMARATDARGRVQALERNADLRNGLISHVLPVEVEVAS